MEQTDIFTEYNSSLINQIDRDPLGFQQIWTHFGQKIFESKTTSVATDIRNYTINLVHHNIIRQLPEKATTFWNIVSQQSYKEGIEKSIILLEMMLAHSRVVSGNEWKESRGILGTSMAFKRWENGEGIVDLGSDLTNPSWESDNKKSFEMLLVRQVSLGINGRYKGPFMRMGFFESDYRYANHTDEWKKIDAAINEYPILKELQDSVFRSLGMVKKEVLFSDSSLWCKAYQNAFNKHVITAGFSREFWPDHLGFGTGAAKAIFEILMNNAPCQNNLSGKQIFEEAKNNVDSKETNDIINIQNILNIEPILVKLDAIFRILLKTKGTEVDVSNIIEIVGSYDVPSHAPQRLKNLIRSLKMNTNVIKTLLEYHEDIMCTRGNMPWIRILNNGQLKVYLQGETSDSVKDLEKYLDIDSDVWIHPYYISSMEDIVCGMTKDSE